MFNTNMEPLSEHVVFLFECNRCYGFGARSICELREMCDLYLVESLEFSSFALCVLLVQMCEVWVGVPKLC